MPTGRNFKPRQGRGDCKHFVPLDDCLETMRQTGFDMSEKYTETATRGLTVNVMEC